MERTSLKKQKDLLEHCVKRIHSRPHFKQLDETVLENILREGDYLIIKPNEHLLYEGENKHQEIYVLIEGSLLVMSQGHLIMRLDDYGDIIGELSVLQPSVRYADVITESITHLVSFPVNALQLPSNASHAPIIYAMLAYELAHKLRVTTAQSLLRKSDRVLTGDLVKVAVIDENTTDRLLIRGIIEANWPESIVLEYANPMEFIENPLAHHLGLVVMDLLFTHPFESDDHAIQEAFKAMKLQGAPILIVSDYCNDVIRREALIKLGADELEKKPYSVFDLRHTITKLKIWFYKHRELDRIEHDAETDQLTGLANRRRLNEFLEALVTLSPDPIAQFSLIMADVDNFKHYNDTHGHPMGDIVLSRVASLLEQNVRRGDLAARFGGEEFVMVLPNCGLNPARKVAEKLRRSIELEEFPFQDQQPTGNLTATFGVASFPPATTVEELLKEADACLYEGKNKGRNIVIVSKATSTKLPAKV
ncbi:MAG: diguanylate cyclase [SAR324 cluster bacterium]|nr:diguanylate cyclase [SAR324 cluster bacterium]